MHTATVKCCFEGCKKQSEVEFSLIPADWNAHWYCINHRGKDQFTRKDNPDAG